MSMENAPTLPPIGTPAKEWAQDTQHTLLGETTAEPAAINENEDGTRTPVGRQAMSRNQTMDSMMSTVEDIPGGWDREWDGAPTKGPIPIDTEKIYNTVAGTVGAVGQTIQSGVASLTSPTSTTTASGPVSSNVAGVTQRVQETVGGLYQSIRSTVAPATGPTASEVPAHVAGLLPAPETPTAAGHTTDVASSTGGPAGYGTGGAMINTSPPNTHTAASHEVSYRTPPSSEIPPRGPAAPSGPSPIDGIPAGETRANTETTHVGNYAYTDLPTKEGNTTDPNPNTGYIAQAQAAIGSATSGTATAGVGYLQSAMAAVGLGGAAAATTAAIEHEHDKGVPPAATATTTSPVTHDITSAPAPIDKTENILSPPSDAITSPHGPDHDVQIALAKAEGRPTPTFDDEVGVTAADGSGGPTSSTPAKVAAASGTSSSTAPAPVIRTTSNTHEKTAAAPAESSYSKPEPSSTAATSEHAGGSTTTPATSSEKPVVTTTNIHDAVAPATSPATALSSATGPPSSTENASTASSSSPIHTREGTGVTSNSAASSSSPNKHKRGPSFMNKVKGEMKVITGKLSGNEAKVEEGRALKSGVPKSATSPTSAKP